MDPQVQRVINFLLDAIGTMGKMGTKVLSRGLRRPTERLQREPRAGLEVAECSLARLRSLRGHPQLLAQLLPMLDHLLEVGVDPWQKQLSQVLAP